MPLRPGSSIRTRRSGCRGLYERAKTVVVQSQASSFNDFVIQAIEEKIRRLTEAEIDAASRKRRRMQTTSAVRSR